VTNKNKMIFYITYLRGSAYNWFESTFTNFLKNNLENHKAIIMNTFNSYVIFKANLKKVYNNMDEEHIMKRQLQALY
jgi:hypothetical protein